MNIVETSKLTKGLFKTLPKFEKGSAQHVQIYSPSNLFENLVKNHYAQQIKSAFTVLKTNSLIPDFFVENLIENLYIFTLRSFSEARAAFKKFLEKEQYTRVTRAYDPGSYHVKGDIIVVISYGTGEAFRFEFFGEDLEKIIKLDSANLRAVEEIEAGVLFPKITFEKNKFIEVEIVNGNQEFYKDFVLDIKTTPTFSDDVIDLHLATIPISISQKKLFHHEMNQWMQDQYDIYYIGLEEDKFIESFPELKNISFIESSADKGFVYDTEKIAVLTDREAFGKLELTSKIRGKNKISKLFEDQVNIGDFIVHEFHGIGVYEGIQSKHIDNEDKDFIVLRYLEGDTLFIPMDQTKRLTKYVGNEEAEPKLTRLGSAEWEHIKQRIAKSIEDLTDELLDLYAKRELSKGFEYNNDTEMMAKLEASFPYNETEDQTRAILEIKEDMESEKPMDRLLIGDVGFGKTEIAVRTAFKAVLDHKQVAVLAPTTVLAAQLHSVFSERLKDFPVIVSRLTRFDGIIKNKETIEKLKEGKVDIIIGTHRLLSADVEFKDLGLLIIDEEQRFGVKQKEKIKKVRINVDVLSMSATPIPRTLQMSLAGIRDISILSIPPKGRRKIITSIITHSEVDQPIKDEISRGGQVFFVHNNIETIESAQAKLEQEIPGIRVVIGHGRMTGDKLEKVMFEFISGQYDLLLATTIIENGLDLPNVNTIIVDDAHKFGLSQLHQLRGRVGRGKVQAYCYLVVPRMKVSKDIEEAIEEDLVKNVSSEGIDRVKTLVANQELGAGFRIASKDMEMRGSGNILGSQQSGNINAIGYELYMRLLAEQIERKKRLAENVI